MSPREIPKSLSSTFILDKEAERIVEELGEKGQLPESEMLYGHLNDDYLRHIHGDSNAICPHQKQIDKAIIGFVKIGRLTIPSQSVSRYIQERSKEDIPPLDINTAHYLNLIPVWNDEVEWDSINDFSERAINFRPFSQKDVLGYIHFIQRHPELLIGTIWTQGFIVDYLKGIKDRVADKRPDLNEDLEEYKDHFSRSSNIVRFLPISIFIGMKRSGQILEEGEITLDDQSINEGFKILNEINAFSHHLVDGGDGYPKKVADGGLRFQCPAKGLITDVFLKNGCLLKVVESAKRALESQNTHLGHYAQITRTQIQTILNLFEPMVKTNNISMFYLLNRNPQEGEL